MRKRPTWVSWEILPALLRVRAERRTPDELADLGILSDAAYRIARALDEAGGVLPTADLRTAAGFPTGKEHRAAYLKATEELEGLLILAKVFPEGAGDGDRMSHALVSMRYADATSAADAMSADEAFTTLIRLYLRTAAFLAPKPFAAHLKVSEDDLRSAADGMLAGGELTRSEVPGYKGECLSLA